jgi:hypothetical protein
MRRRKRRLDREKKTLEAMIALYCRNQHNAATVPCHECAALLAYAHQRLDRCPWGEGKPTCLKCPIHCYEPEMREQVRRVMRYAGPRMLLHHPIMAIAHLLDGLGGAQETGPKDPREDNDPGTTSAGHT